MNRDCVKTTEKPKRQFGRFDWNSRILSSENSNLQLLAQNTDHIALRHIAKIDQNTSQFVAFFLLQSQRVIEIFRGDDASIQKQLADGPDLARKERFHQ